MKYTLHILIILLISILLFFNYKSSTEIKSMKIEHRELIDMMQNNIDSIYVLNLNAKNKLDSINYIIIELNKKRIVNYNNFNIKKEQINKLIEDEKTDIPNITIIE